jgi:hypothetical protein
MVLMISSTGREGNPRKKRQISAFPNAPHSPFHVVCLKQKSRDRDWSETTPKSLAAATSKYCYQSALRIARFFGENLIHPAEAAVREAK